MALSHYMCPVSPVSAQVVGGIVCLILEMATLSPSKHCRSNIRLAVEEDLHGRTYGSRDVSAPSCPINVDVLAFLVRVVGVFWLDSERVRTEVITLCLQQVGRQVFSTVSIVETQSSAEGRCGNSPESAL